MRLITKPENEAILSGVGAVSEFTIKATAKSFSILSSALYGNKVKAVIRELSTNASDSQIDAGTQDTPFEVHLPYDLEPWFSIRDFGTGLTHKQIVEVYTTYFESTKTDSDLYTGALGLGSKSPFSITDNFTVTAIKDGRKGIYTAFINDAGVPGVAQMAEEFTDEPSGVEVRFAVNDSSDFYKFREEAAQVYRYFNLRPTVTGNSQFQFVDNRYSERDLIPGVHYISGRASVAVMGQVAYPIEVPNAKETIGPELIGLLSCGLELNFDIGELDFQASREGLSYIPQTIAAIKSKLEQVHAVIFAKVEAEANAIENLWERAFYLIKKTGDKLWADAAKHYIQASDIPTVDTKTMWQYYPTLTNPTFTVLDLATKYNIVIRGFTYQARYSSTGITQLQPNKGNHFTQITDPVWHISVSADTTFVCNDTKTGVLDRAKYHWRLSQQPATVYALDIADRSKPVYFEAFLKAIHNPPKVLQASVLSMKATATRGSAANVTILSLVNSSKSYYTRDTDFVWRDAGKASDFSPTKTYYYLPLSGYTVISKTNLTDAYQLARSLSCSGIERFSSIVVHGVRKTDIDFIKTQKNWVNLEDYLTAELKKTDSNIVTSLVRNQVKIEDLIDYGQKIAELIDAPNSLYKRVIDQFDKDVAFSPKPTVKSLKWLIEHFGKGKNLSTKPLLDDITALRARYPLLAHLHMSGLPGFSAVADYINGIDGNLTENIDLVAEFA